MKAIHRAKQQPAIPTCPSLYIALCVFTTKVDLRCDAFVQKSGQVEPVEALRASSHLGSA